MKNRKIKIRELETAARIGVAYGQGYYLYAPGVHFVE